jgi:hypothetical protein
MAELGQASIRRPVAVTPVGRRRSRRSVPAAGRLDDLTVDPAALGARQEGDDAGDVVGLAETTARNLAVANDDALANFAVA